MNWMYFVFFLTKIRSLVYNFLRDLADQITYCVKFASSSKLRKGVRVRCSF
jgi:hypothetical protein